MCSYSLKQQHQNVTKNQTVRLTKETKRLQKSAEITSGKPQNSEFSIYRNNCNGILKHEKCKKW